MAEPLGNKRVFSELMGEFFMGVSPNRGTLVAHQLQGTTEQSPLRPSELDLTAIVEDEQYCESPHSILLHNLRDTLFVARLPLDMVVSAQLVLDAVEERKHRGVKDRTVDRQVLEAVLVELHRAKLRTASMPHLMSSYDFGTSSSSSSSPHDDLTGDPWEEAEDLATIDLLDFFSESLQAAPEVTLQRSCAADLLPVEPVNDEEDAEDDSRFWAEPIKALHPVDDIISVMPTGCFACDSPSCAKLASKSAQSGYSVDSALIVPSSTCSTRCSLSSSSTMSTSSNTLTSSRCSIDTTSTSVCSVAEKLLDPETRKALSRSSDMALRSPSKRRPATMPAMPALDLSDERPSGPSWQQMWRRKLDAAGEKMNSARG